MAYINFDEPVDADRAIVILTLRRALRPKGANGEFIPGWGANRDDHPIFTDVCNRWAQNRPIDKDVIFQARFRAKKYARQVQETDWWKNNLTFKQLMDLLTTTTPAADKDLEAQVMEVIKEAAGYGGW